MLERQLRMGVGHIVGEQREVQVAQADPEPQVQPVVGVVRHEILVVDDDVGRLVSAERPVVLAVVVVLGEEIRVAAEQRELIVEGRSSGEVVATGDLTAREVGILRLVAEGHLNVEIGRRLGLTAGTVKWYLHRIYGKLGCRRRVNAIEQGRRLGLID